MLDAKVSGSCDLGASGLDESTWHVDESLEVVGGEVDEVEGEEAGGGGEERREASTRREG